MNNNFNIVEILDLSNYATETRVARRKGGTVSDEVKQKISDTINKKWENNEIIFSDDARRRCSEAGKNAAKIKKCYIDENGNEVWMRPSNKSQHHPNWKLKN